MWQQWSLRNKQFSNHNKQDKNLKKIQYSFYVRVCVYVENTAMASWINIWFVRPCVCVCVCVCMLGKSIDPMCP